MTYFSLRKPAEEPEPDEAEDEADETEEAPAPDPPKRRGYGPVRTGLLGPGQWIAARFGTGWAWGVHGAAVWAIGFYGDWIAVGIVTVWLSAVLAFVPREHLERLATTIEHRSTPTPKTPAAPSPGDEREAVCRLLLDTLGEADTVHLRTVLAHLHKHGQWEGKTVTDLRARLALLGIPHDRRVKVAGVPTWGVRRAALQAPSPAEIPTPSEAPSPPV